MRQGQPAQRPSPRRSQTNPNLAPVFGAGTTHNRAGLFQPVDQFHRAVMLDEQAGRNLSNGGLHIFGKPLNGQKELMLLRLNAVFFGSGLAEMKKSPDLPAEFGQVTVLLSGE